MDGRAFDEIASLRLSRRQALRRGTTGLADACRDYNAVCINIDLACNGECVATHDGNVLCSRRAAGGVGHLLVNGQDALRKSGRARPPKTGRYPGR